MDHLKEKKQNLVRRHHRIRGKISGTASCPRFLVFRSHQHIYGQLIDDEKAKTLLSVSDKEIKKTKAIKKTLLAKEVGNLLAKKAQEQKIKKVVFDRRGYQFHGRVKQLADGAREGGLRF